MLKHELRALDVLDNTASSFGAMASISAFLYIGGARIPDFEVVKEPKRQLTPK